MLNLAIASFILITGCQATAQPTDTLKNKINEIVSTKNATVGVSLIGNSGSDAITINGDAHFPMQSVFKFHIAIAVLAEVDKGNLSLNQQLTISEKDLMPGTWSPMAKKYPVGTSLSIGEIIGYAVSQSDNVACDMLLRLLGGPEKVNQYFAKNNFTDISIIVNEAEMQKDWETQFKNWTTPNSATNVIKAFYENDSLLSAESHTFLWETMKATSTGMMRFRGQLPADAVIAHKTGSSGTDKTTGITAAVNDIGIIFLPNGEFFILSVLITDSRENEAANEKIIADITKACWDFYSTDTK